jgi:NitT/TauT family transport system substrate-binding protein
MPGILLLGLVLLGCKEQKQLVSDGTVSLTLDWRPEPEFGGFYQAKLSGEFQKHGLRVSIINGSAGAPTWQLVANGKTDFATTAADQVLLARSQGAEVVALFAVYQTSPQGIMVHEDRDFKKMQDDFTNTGTLGAENNPWLKFLLAKFGKPVVEITPDPQGIGVFLARKDYSQQCFVTSEPILVEHEGQASRTFLVADEGFNPYVTVLITSGKMLREQPDVVNKMTEACRAGWRAYLDDPSAANKVMHELNHDMDLKTFEDAAGAQKRLIQNEFTLKHGLGTMTLERWKTLAQQLVDLKVIDKAPPAEECFVNPK